MPGMQSKATNTRGEIMNDWEYDNRYKLTKLPDFSLRNFGALDFLCMIVCKGP